MSIRIAEVIRVLEEFAPLGLAEEWDAIGLQLGDPEQDCSVVAVALDLMHATLEEAVAAEAELIVVHHPLLFRPVPKIRYDRPQGHLIQRLCAEKIALYAAHTNLDSTAGGLNDYLAGQIELTAMEPLIPPRPTTPDSFRKQTVGLGRVGLLKQPGTLNQLAKKLAKTFSPEAMRIIGHEHQEVTRVALCTGSGGSLMREAIASGADCYVTGDVKYHQALDAEAAGMAVLDVGHYATEISAIEILMDVLKKSFGKKIRTVPLTTAHDPIRPYQPL